MGYRRRSTHGPAPRACPARRPGPAGRACRRPPFSPRPPRSPAHARDARRPCARWCRGRAAGARAPSRRGRPCDRSGWDRPGGRAATTRPRQRPGRAAARPGCDSATATSAGHNRSCTSVSFPRISFAQATVSSIGVQRREDQLSLRMAPPGSANRLARDARRRRRKLRVVEQQQPLLFEQALDPPSCGIDLCVGGRRRRDSNPRRFRATVFKTVAFDHSATPPDLIFLVEPGPSYPHCPVREAHVQAPGSLLTIAASGSSPSTMRNAGCRKPTAAAVGSGSCSALPSTATVSPSRSTDLAVARAPLLGRLGQHAFQDAAPVVAQLEAVRGQEPADVLRRGAAFVPGRGRFVAPPGPHLFQADLCPLHPDQRRAAVVVDEEVLPLVLDDPPR